MPEPASSRRGGGALRLGRVAGTEVFLSSSWFVVAALVAVVMAPRVEQVRPGLGAGTYAVGVVVAIVLYGAVLLHEISHALVARHYGHEVNSITLSFVGGRTEVSGEAETPLQEFWTAVVGPITSLAVGGVALVAVFAVPDGLLLLVVEALAFSNLLLGLLNLLPAMPLDGGRVLKAIVWRLSGSSVRGVVVAGWGGRIAAVVVLVLPFAAEPLWGRPLTVVDVIVVVVLGGFLWTTASLEMRGAVMRDRVSGLRAGDLSRPALSVAGDLPLAEALRRAGAAGLTAIITTDSAGRPVGVVHEAALQAVPPERRPWVSVATVARSLEPGRVLAPGLVGRRLLEAINEAPAAEYVVTDGAGSPPRVLALADLDRAVRAR